MWDVSTRSVQGEQYLQRHLSSVDYNVYCHIITMV